MAITHTAVKAPGNTLAAAEWNAAHSGTAAPDSHGLSDNTKHSSALTNGKMVKSNANGLPADATNTDTDVASAVSLKHTQGTDQALDTGGANEITAANAKAAYTHSQNNNQAHTDYLKNDANDSTSGILKTTADQEAADTEYFANILFGTDATPPAANTVARGSIYVQYTA